MPRSASTSPPRSRREPDGRPRPWPTVWADAATGPAGYWRHHRVDAGFRTAANTSEEYAEAVLALLDADLEIRRVVDIGAGEGALATRIGARRPDLQVVAVDVRRPVSTGSAVLWCLDCWEVQTDRWRDGRVPELFAQPVRTLVIASEWLDELPVGVLQCTDDSGPARVLVDANGRESADQEVTAADRAWAEEWWPAGRRIEVGRSRDRAWEALIGLIRPAGGLALMVDYGHHRSSRPPDGTLRAFAGGRQVAVLPDGRRNLTCDVAVDAVRAAGERAGATTRLEKSQREVVPSLLGGRGGTGPADGLTELVGRSSRHALLSDTGFGSYRWLVQEVAAR